jgi:RimJ/RimL family protein N-acetyltransferase
MMIALKEDEYDKVKEPLAAITVNNLFARAVVERCISGKVYVDDALNPKTFYVAHPYGLSMLFGAVGHDAFNSGLVDYLLNTSGLRVREEQLQVFQEDWLEKLTELFCDHGLRSRDNGNEGSLPKKGMRINFKFNRPSYLASQKLFPRALPAMVRTDRDLFEKARGMVIPKFFWRNADHFYRDGVGFTAIENDEPASTAFSSFILDGQLEIGIETSEKYRKRNLALGVCSAIIDYCLEKNYEPVWACRADNTASYRLALKLGFEPVASIPYYHLPA